MERKQMVKELEALPALLAEARKFQTWDNGQLVAFGILTEEELGEWVELQLLENRIHDDVEAAGNAVPWAMKEYPKEYQDVLSRLHELKPRFDQEKAVRDAVVALKGRYTGGDLCDRLNVEDLANDVWHSWEKTEDTVSKEYYDVDKRRERLERVGTKVNKIRMAVFDAHNAAEKEAKAKKEEELKLQYGVLLKRKKELDRLIESRRRARFEPIRKQIRELLDKVAQATAKDVENAK